ncbi:MAG TPA: hypothetical protein VLR94_06770, partial [Acidobacteriota bacterium]|nr:hypothetical protein [Acidobacteriota bacterium]
MRAARNHAVDPLNDADAIHDLVGLLYEAAVDCRRWSAFLERLVVLTDERFASLVTREFGVESAAPGLILLRRIPPQSSRFEALYSVLGKHLRRAVELQRRVRDIERQNAALKTAIDHFATGLILLDTRTRVLLMNASAGMILSRKDGLVLRDGLLTAENQCDANVLSRALRLALGKQAAKDNGKRSGMVWISRSSGRRPLGVVICLTQPESPLSMMSALAVYLSD